MQENKKKNNETKIGKIIYGFLLFLPLLAIGTTCLISTFNQEAKNEVTAVYKYETNEVNSANDLIVGHIYHYTRNIESLNTDYVIGRFKNIYNFNNSKDNFVTAQVSEAFQMYKNNGLSVNIANYPTYSNVANLYNLNANIEFDCIFYELHTNDSYEYYSISTYNEIIDYNTSIIDSTEIFYNSIDKVQQSPLFNWSEDTLIYNAVETFTTALNINNSFFPQLMTYWLIITAAYLVYDIGLLMLLVCHKKIHELGDNI